MSGTLQPCPNCATSQMVTAVGECAVCGTLLGPGTGHWQASLTDVGSTPRIVLFDPAVEMTFPVDFGDYRLLKKLGAGGMGTVYLGEQKHLLRQDAVKILTRENAEKPGFVERFLREMRAAGALRHPNIVQAYHAGEACGHYFLAMECLQGEDLEALHKCQGPIPLPQACEWILQAAEALHFAHSAGLIHRDVKPSNLFLTTDHQIKLLDLGLARPLLEDPAAVPELTGANEAMGTPDYMSPEQWTDAHDVDARADVYALGCTLYTLIAGHTPYAECRTMAHKALAHQTYAVPDLGSACPQAPTSLVQLIQRCLAKRREDRPATAREFATSLQAIIPTLGVAQPVTRRPSRSRALAPVLGGLAISGVLVLGGLVVREALRKPPRQPEPAPSTAATAPASPSPTSPSSSSTTAPLTPPKEPANEVARVEPEPQPQVPQVRPSPKRPDAEGDNPTTPTPPDARPALPPTWLSPATAMEFALIPAGTFTMGASVDELEARDDEKPPHTVQLTRPFYLGRYEVTQDDYEKVMESNPSHFAMPGSRFPVEQVSWFEAVEFCNNLSVRDKLPEHYALKSVKRKEGRIVEAAVSVASEAGYRLPTEAEWEYACRANTTTPFSFGSQANGTTSNIDGTVPYGTTEPGPNLKRTAPVGTYPKNAFGLADLHGNVWEWCDDVYDPAAYAAHQSSTAIDPHFTSGSQFRVMRGGGWINNARSSRSASRLRSLPDNATSYIGFRVALTSK